VQGPRAGLWGARRLAGGRRPLSSHRRAAQPAARRGHRKPRKLVQSAREGSPIARLIRTAQGARGAGAVSWLSARGAWEAAAGGVSLSLLSLRAPAPRAPSPRRPASALFRTSMSSTDHRLNSRISVSAMVGGSEKVTREERRKGKSEQGWGVRIFTHHSPFSAAGPPSPHGALSHTHTNHGRRPQLDRVHQWGVPLCAAVAAGPPGEREAPSRPAPPRIGGLPLRAAPKAAGALDVPSDASLATPVRPGPLPAG